jgi:AcrR family transcriptional regulator
VTWTAEKPLRADAERNRRRILDAAGELFATRGLEVTMDEIAAQAGLGVGTIYRRFPNRDAVAEQLFADGLDRVVALADAALAEPDPWEGLVSLLEGVLELMAADRGLRALMVGPARGHVGAARARAAMAPRVGELVRRAQEAGTLRGDVDRADIPITLLMIGSVMEYSGDLAPGLWRRMLALVLDGLRPTRDGATPLPAPPVPIDDVQRIMGAWRPRAD